MPFPWTHARNCACRVDELRLVAGSPAAAGRLAHTDKKALRVDHATVRIAIRKLYEVDYLRLDCRAHSRRSHGSVKCDPGQCGNTFLR
jgi:hypothetical protein